MRNKEYWIVQIQNELYGVIDRYMKENHLNRTNLAEKLHVTKGYITQVLNGDFDHKISKLVDLALACEVVPLIHFVKTEEFVKNDSHDKIYEIFPVIRSTEIIYKTDLSIKADNETKNNWIENIQFQKNVFPNGDTAGKFEFNQA